MSNELQSNNKMEELKSNPSVFLWEVELRRILRGERDGRLIQLGSADEYVRVLLASSADRAFAHAVFHDALRSVVQTWHPSTTDADDYILRMLDLIGSFTPAPGFIKTLDFIQRWKRFDDSLTRYSGTKDIRLKALIVLGNYYRCAPPVMQEIAFEAYVNLLQQHLQYPRYCGYSAGRLIELGVLKIESVESRNLLRDNPASLSEILTLLLQLAKRWATSTELTHLYTHCLSLGRDVVILFERVLILNQASLDLAPDGPVINFEGEAFRLIPDPELYVSVGFPEPEEQIRCYENKVKAFALAA
jgi:hypothetical protein